VCSSNCPTQDHKNWGECVAAKNIVGQWLGGVQPSFGEQKKFQGVNDRYRSAVSQGLMPGAVSNRAIDSAYREAESRT